MAFKCVDVLIIKTNKLNSDTIVKCIQFIACTCWISEGEKRKILRCHKSSKQKKAVLIDAKPTL